MDISELLIFAVKQNASDIHISAGEPPLLRIHGEMKKIEMLSGQISSFDTKLNNINSSATPYIDITIPYFFNNFVPGKGL